MGRSSIVGGFAVLAIAAVLCGGGGIAAAANESDTDAHEVPVAAGTLDDGQELLSLAQLTIGEAVAAAQDAVNGRIGEVDLEYVGETLVYNVDVGNHDVKVDAATGAVIAVDSDD